MTSAAVGLLLGMSGAADLRIIDVFDRDVTERGITLLDWDGYIANPAVKLKVQLPEDVQAGSDLYLHGTNNRIHFDRSDADDRTGIGKRIRLNGTKNEAEFYVSMFPDRDGLSEQHELVLQLFGPDRREQKRFRVPIRVIDQDTGPVAERYPIHLRFDEDRTGFFGSLEVQRVIRQAAADWAFFLDDQGVDPVPAGDETIRIWNTDGFKTQRSITNPLSYRGYLLYVTGIHHDEMRAGGSPTLVGKPHRAEGQELPLRRAGTCEFDIAGNWNRMGWYLAQGDHDWWVSGNLRNEQNDLYSIAVHEMGHALGFEGTYPRWGAAKKVKKLEDPTLTAYLGSAPGIDASDHLVGAIDTLSRYGGFGMEYLGPMKERRWLITKSHLLALQALGYRIRETSAFQPLKVARPRVFSVKAGERITTRVLATGGVPDYHFDASGLPQGLTIDSFTGAITGIAAQGDYTIGVTVEDQDPTTPPVKIEFQIAVS